MARPPTQFLTRLRRLDSPFTTEQATDLFGHLSQSSVKVYLSHAARAGLIEQIGFKKFRHIERQEEKHPLPQFAGQVVARLRAEFMPSAFEQLVIWGDHTMAPFLHDATPDPFVVIESGKHAVRTADNILSSDFDTLVIHNHQKLGDHLFANQNRKRAQIFLIESSHIQATRPSGHGFQVPTLGRLLTSVLSMPALFPEVPLRIMESPTFRLQDALSATRSKMNAAKLGALVSWIINHNPEHPVRAEAERLKLISLGAR